MSIIATTFVCVLGAIIGSFLNVVIYRFHTGRSLSGRSHCLSCGKQLVWYELVPVFSYIFLLGRCRVCHARISTQYVLVEILTAGLFFLVFILVAGVVSLALHLMLVSLLVVLVGYDMRHTIIPDTLVAGVLVVAVGIFGWNFWSGVPSIWASLAGAGLASGFFAFLWLVSRGRWIGLGDAKLAFPLGLLAGLNGALSFVIFSFWIGAGISLAVIGTQYVLRYTRPFFRGQLRLGFLTAPLTIKSEVPFAPFLVLSFVLVYFLGADALLLTQKYIVLLTEL